MVSGDVHSVLVWVVPGNRARHGHQQEGIHVPGGPRISKRTHRLYSPSRRWPWLGEYTALIPTTPSSPVSVRFVHIHILNITVTFFHLLLGGVTFFNGLKCKHFPTSLCIWTAASSAGRPRKDHAARCHWTPRGCDGQLPSQHRGVHLPVWSHRRPFDQRSHYRRGPRHLACIATVLNLVPV